MAGRARKLTEGIKEVSTSRTSRGIIVLLKELTLLVGNYTEDSLLPTQLAAASIYKIKRFYNLYKT